MVAEPPSPIEDYATESSGSSCRIRIAHVRSSALVITGLFRGRAILALIAYRLVAPSRPKGAIHECHTRDRVGYLVQV